MNSLTKISKKNTFIYSAFTNVFIWSFSDCGYIHSYILFVLSRLLCGVAGAAYEVCQAMGIDISDEGSRAKNIGYLTAGVSVGYIFWPILAGISSTNYFSWTSLWLPFMAGAILSLLNLMLVQIFLYQDQGKAPI